MKLSGCTGQPGTQTIGRPASRSPIPAQVVGQAHAAGRVPRHGVDAAVAAQVPAATTAQASGARRSIHSQVVIGWPVARSTPDGGPVSLGLVGLVGDRALDHEEERAQPARRGAIPDLQELVAVLVSQHRVVEVDLGQARDGPRVRGPRGSAGSRP